MKPVYPKGQKRIARFNKETGALVDYIPVGEHLSQKAIDSTNNQLKTVHNKYKWYEFRHLRLFLNRVKRTIRSTWNNNKYEMVVIVLMIITIIVMVILS